MEQQSQLEREFREWEPIEIESDADTNVEEQQLNLAPRKATARFRDRDPTHKRLPTEDYKVKGCKQHEDPP
ncbi:hypothetical protein M501DRAFT_1055864 [Patellaria atrata CBS 101060]|uniref:Uncharacterized protein n=1 Tax=Patellaria atrata CBS 101060 TaxID=1346257 RepID=A0A9P4SD51_9PEZI|nr:hypothetical protein M501DRAFT_1055864 [Patellaria atrata CBS 101060]